MKRAVHHEPASLDIAATEFKARCLELMQKVHDRKCDSVTITKRGKPFVKLVAIAPGKGDVYGCLKGQARISGDLTMPLEWA